MGDFPRAAFFDPVREFIAISPEQITDAFNTLIRDINETFSVENAIALSNGIAEAWWFGIVGNGTDESTKIQTAIDFCAANGIQVLRFSSGKTYICNVVLKNNVVLAGPGGTSIFGYIPTALGESRPVLKAPPATGGIIVDTPAGGVSRAAIVGIDFYGAGEFIAATGVRFRAGGIWSAIKCCHFYSFADEAIWVESGANVVEDILAVEGLLNRTRAFNTGVVRIEGSDNIINRVESTASVTALTSANMRCAGIYVGGANQFFTNCIGEISDVGFYISSSNSRLIGCRADRNYGHGFLGATQMLSACEALNNSADGDNLYSGFNTNSAQSGSYVGCNAVSLVGTHPHKYGFDDPGTYAAVVQRCEFRGCRSSGHGTALFHTGASWAFAQSFEIGSAALRGTGATPNIEGTTLYVPVDAAPVSITNFLGGVTGQDLYVVGNTNVTIVNGASIVTKSGANITFASSLPVLFKNISDNKWFQV